MVTNHLLTGMILQVYYILLFFKRFVFFSDSQQPPRCFMMFVLGFSGEGPGLRKRGGVQRLSRGVS